jgi:hypothetical protein
MRAGSLLFLLALPVIPALGAEDVARPALKLPGQNFTLHERHWTADKVDSLPRPDEGAQNFRLLDYDRLYLDLRSDEKGRYTLATPDVFGADLVGDIRHGGPMFNLTWPPGD